VTPLLLAFVLAAGPAPAEVRAVRLTTIDFRPALRVLTSDDMPPGTVVREGEDVVIRLPGVAPEELPLPTLEPPLAELRVEREPAATVLRVKVPPGVPYETGQEPGMVTVIFGEPPSPAERGPITPELYRLLFPTSVMEKEPSEEEKEGKSPPESSPEGISVGRVVLRPYVSAGYVDADVLASGTPEPTRARYLEVSPGVTATTPLMTGRLAAEYEPRLRFFSDIPEITKTSHFAGARFELSLGSRTLLRIGDRFTRAVLETTVVDPGREYFYDLAPYTYNNTTLDAAVDVGPSLTLDLGAGFQWTRFDSSHAGFFNYDSQVFRAGLGYDLRSDLRARVTYAYDRIPTPSERPVAGSSAHNVLATLDGDITPLTSGSLTAGLRHQTNPLATPGGDSFTGFIVIGNLHRELGYRSALGLQLLRSTEPSNFEDNAYYVTNQVTVSLDVPVPFGLWARGSGLFLRNSYPTVSTTEGVKRRDDLWAWTLGVGRELGWRTWVRADYRCESRHSNLPGFDVTTDGFVVQVGFGRFSQGAGR
jgi:hypothetical protein